jgi:Zn finger protein HypA/HybF involved in hydrogenase expression
MRGRPLATVVVQFVASLRSLWGGTVASLRPAGRRLFAMLKRVGERVVAPLRTGEGPNKFNLSSVETSTTTYNRSVGWVKRPPTLLRCPRCESEIYQGNARDDIDCPRCVAAFDAEEFADLELLSMECPICRDRMQHGQRHPEKFDFPEWATCNSCRYHWEFKHSYSD